MNKYTPGEQAADGLVNVDGIALIITETSIDIGCVLPDIDEDEIQAWQSGLMSCGLYYNNKAPFFFLGFNNMFFAHGLNFKKLKLWQMALWLTPKQKIVNLALIEKSGFRIKAIFSVSVSQAHTAYLQSIAARQLLMSKKSITYGLIKLQQKMDAENMLMSKNALWLKQ